MAVITQNGGGQGGSRWRIAVWGISAFLLLLPLLAMQFTTEVTWTGSDFGAFGAMLVAACGSYELAARMTGNTAYRAAVAVGIVAAFLLVWVNLAVGIIGSESNPANLLFGGVLGIGLIGALIARFEPQGMARVLIATALAQAAVLVIALIALTAELGPLFMLTGFFVALWLLSAWLFRKAAREQTVMGATA